MRFLNKVVKKFSLLVMLLLCFTLVACNVTSSSSSSSSSNPTSSSSSSSTLDTTGTISIAEAIRIAEETGETQTSEKYTIIGTITEVRNTTYGNLVISDGEDEILIYGTYSEDGKTRYDALSYQPIIGDTIKVTGVIVNYKGNTPEMVDGWILDYTKGTSNGGDNDFPAAGTKLTIAEAIEVAKKAGEEGSEHKYIVEGVILTVSNPMYGEMTISDGVDSLYIYGTYSKDGLTRYSDLEDKPYAGDVVVLLGTLKMFNSKAEMGAGWIQSFEKDEFDIADYNEASVEEAREAADSSKLLVSGVVAAISYANGYKPNGFYLVDNNASIYVYGVDCAARVEVGNTVTIAAVKDFYIPDDSTNNATKWGYKGACQLTDARLVENDEGNKEFNKNWIEDTTVKEILNTPVSENITSNIYKVNAYINKVVEDGYVNYFFNDIDGTTGSYTYTQCSGGDFTWLDKYHGKICTVYLSVINVKVEYSGYVYRLFPIAVEDNDYKFAVENAPEYAIEYHAADQFKNLYTADPNLELVTSVSSSILGFENVKVEYSSSNTDAVYFETVDDKVYLRTKELGETTVTIKATYEGYVATREIKIEVAEAPKFDFVNITTAIAGEFDVEYTLQGVVTSSVINQDGGFYLSDETGIIAVKLADASAIFNIAIGDEIVIKGTKKKRLYKEEETMQTYIDSAVVLANNFGNKAHSTASFKTVTAEELIALANDKSVDRTTQGYITTAKITKFEDPRGFYTNYYIGTEDGKTIQLYAASKYQYEMLEPYVDQTIQLEVAICDWNLKSEYRFCLIAVYVDGEKIINDYNFK